MRKAIKKTLVLTGVAAFSYLLALGIFFASLSLSINLAKKTYVSYQDNGLTQQVLSDYKTLLREVEKVAFVAQGPLVSPIIAASGFSEASNKVIDLFKYSRSFMDVLPQFAGAGEIKKYLVAFQNPAESRGTGGLIGAFAVVQFQKGRIEVLRVGSNSQLQHGQEIPIKLPAEFSNIYRSDPAMWLNSNMSPHFPYGARIWLALWQKQFQESLDGVITLDPIVLSQLLKVTGPITIRNKQISSQNVVQETLSDAYLTYESDNLGRKQYLVEIIEGVAKAIQRPDIDKVSLAYSITDSILENRVLIYSADPAIQSALRKSKLSGVLSKKQTNEFRLVVQNTAGNKMDYYLERELRLTSKSCGPKPITEAYFRIKNSAQKDSYLPAYVKGRLDLGLPAGLENSTSVAAFLYGPPESQILSATDMKTGGSAGYVKEERMRPALVIPLNMNAGEEREFKVEIKGGLGPITAYVQPLVKPQKTLVVDNC